MRHYIICIFLFTAIGTQAQQVNPVPDYVFRNQMSVGRNAVTDTAAYISIGPRYGANKGLMPPIVSDTAAITGVKRNGLLIFSVQRNNFQYWDSINSRWTSVTANVDTTIISTRAWRKKGDDSLGAVIATRTDTTLLSTRAWRQKGLDSLAAIEIDGSGTVNYVPKFTATRTLGNSLIFDNGTNVGIGTTSPVNIGSATGLTINGSGASFLQLQRSAVNALQIGTDASGSDIYEQRTGYMRFGTSNTERLRIFANGRVGVNTTTDAGYQLDVNGTLRTTNGVVLATSSGNVGVGIIPSAWSAGRAFEISTKGNAIWSYDAENIFVTNNSYFDGAWKYGANGKAAVYTLFQGQHFFDIAGTGTAGNTITFTTAMSINSVGAVGIGTTAPTQSLDVNGRIRARTIDSTSSPINVLTSDVNGVIRKTAPGVLGSGTTNYVAKFTASGTVGNSQIFDDGTNVGVGTASPWAKLSLGFSSSLSFGSSSFPFSVSRSASGNLVTTFSDGYDNSNARVDFTMRSGSANTTTPLSIAGTGRIGIGTTSPVYKLDVRGGGIFYDAGGTGGTTTYTYLNGQGGLELKGVTNENIRYEGTHLVFQNGASEQMRITSGGELLINTSTDVGDYRLQVNGNANFRDDVLIDTNLRVNRHISLDQTPKAWALGNAIEGPQGSTLFVAGGGVQTLANIYYDGSYKYSTSNPGAAIFLLQSGITFATYGSGTANGALTGANEMVYAGGELRVGIADQGTFKLQVADKSYLADEVQIASTTDLGNYKLQVTGEAIITAGIRTDAPSGGTAATWKLGTVATVSPTSPNRTIEVEIGGTTYYIHAKTTNN